MLLIMKKMRIHYIFTCSIGGADHEGELYVRRICDTIQKLSEFPITFYIVENNGKRETLLDTFEGGAVVYTDTNIIEGNNAKKEFMDIQRVIELYNIDDNDIVIKQTGRYTIEGSSFVERVVAFKDTADIFMKFYDLCQNTFRYKDCIMGLYAARAYVLKGYFKYLRIKDDACEVSFATYIRDTVTADKIMEIRFLDMYFRGMASMHL